MELLRARLRADWPEINRQIAADNRALWRTLQLVVIFAVMATLVLMALQPQQLSGVLVQACLLPALLALVFWFAVPGGQRPPRKIALACYGLLLLAAALSWWTVPRLVVPVSQALGRQPGPWFAVGLVPLLTVMAMLWSNRAWPARSRLMTMSFAGWPALILIGALIGLAIGVHLIIFVRPWVPDDLEALESIPALSWLFLNEIGLRALVEELVFRGVGLRLLPEGRPHGAIKAILQVSALNALIYLAPALWHGGLLGLCLIGYRLTLSMINGVLRWKFRSVLPGLASNVIFSVIIGVLIT